MTHWCTLAALPSRPRGEPGPREALAALREAVAVREVENRSLRERVSLLEAEGRIRRGEACGAERLRSGEARITPA